MNLTIGIPSYRRPECVEHLLTSAASSCGSVCDIKFIVVNDSGDDRYTDIYAKIIEKFTSVLCIELISHSKNMGYPNTLVELIFSCKTKYLMMISDDDIIDLSGLSEFMSFIHKISPDICSTQYLRDGRIYRGLKHSRKANPEEFRRINGHAPGVVYDTIAVRKGASLVSTLLKRDNAAAYSYPQVLITIDTILRNDNCWFYDGAFVREGIAMPSNIKDALGLHYDELSSRIQQFSAFDTFLRDYPSSEMRDKMLRASRRHCLSLILRSDPALFRNTIFSHLGRSAGRFGRIALRFCKKVLN